MMGLLSLFKRKNKCEPYLVILGQGTKKAYRFEIVSRTKFYSDGVTFLLKGQLKKLAKYINFIEEGTIHCGGKRKGYHYSVVLTNMHLLGSSYSWRELCVAEYNPKQDVFFELSCDDVNVINTVNTNTVTHFPYVKLTQRPFVHPLHDSLSNNPNVFKFTSKGGDNDC